MDCLDSITPMFSREANLSGSEVTKVAMQNGMNGEFTRVNCEIKERVHQGAKRKGASWPVACVNRQRRLLVYGA